MTTANEELVRRAFDACKRGDKDELRRVFGYDDFVQIQGAFCLSGDDYPEGKTDIHYDPEEQRDGTVKTSVRWRSGDEEYYATVVDTVSNGKITASTVEWTDYPYRGDTDNEPPWYAEKYGWWGWPFGRRRR